MKERAKAKKEQKHRVSHQVSKRLSNVLGPSQSQHLQAATADKRMKDVSGKMVAAHGLPKSSQGPSLSNN